MASNDRIWSEAARTLESGKSFALATVINVRGSTPREVGAKMIVHQDGQFGTIGGGCGEAEVFRKARLLLEEGSGARLAEVAPNVPVLLTSGYSVNGPESLCRFRGFKGFLGKPQDYTDLARAIRSALDSPGSPSRHDGVENKSAGQIDQQAERRPA